MSGSWATISSACRWRLEFCSLSLEFDYHRGLQVQACFISKHEFRIEGSISTSGDVYSFGIVLMETFTKRKPTDEMFVGEMNLKQWLADSLFLDAAIDEVVDADILGTEENGDFVSRRDCLSSIMRLALACTAALPGERINMKDAAITLTKIKTKFLKDCEEDAAITLTKIKTKYLKDCEGVNS